jgi:hypothetical protein
MDPTATWAIVFDRTVPLAESAQAAKALMEWIDKGGFPPEGRHAATTRDFCQGFWESYARDRALS